MDARIKTQDSRHSEPDKTLTKIASFSRSKEEKELIQIFRCIDSRGRDCLLAFARREFEYDREARQKTIIARKSTTVHRSIVSMEGWKHGRAAD